MILSLLLAAHAAETFDGRTYYYGDIHAHTGVSTDGWASDGPVPCVSSGRDGVVCGSIADVFDTARANGIDFLALTDHHNSPEAAYNDLLARVLAENDPGTFVTIPGMEMLYKRTGHSYGHKNILVFAEDAAGLDFDALVADRNVRDGYCTTDIWKNAATLTANFGPTLLIAHHPASADVMTTDWYCHSQTYEPVVEVYSGWGNALTLSPDYDPTNLGGGDALTDDPPANASTVHEALETFGLHVGFVGGTDLHDTRPGMTCDRATPAMTGHVYGGGLTMIALEDAAAFDRAAIYGEIAARRTFATSGPMIPVAVEWTVDGAAFVEGEDIEATESGDTWVTVSVPEAYEAAVTAVRAVGYATTLDLTETSPSPGTWTSDAIANADLPAWLYIEVEIDGGAYYGSTVCDDGGADDGERIWSSPVWFQVGPPPDGDGDGSPDLLDCDDSNAARFPGNVATVNDGIDNDCDGFEECYTDADNDNYGVLPAKPSADLDCGDGLEAPVSGDCLDSNRAYRPGAIDPPHDGLDKDCDSTDG